MKNRLLIILTLLTLLIMFLFLNQSQNIMEAEYSLVKIDDKGKAMSNWQGPWACVFDKRTQLYWEVKTDSENIHDGYWSYSWFNGTTGIMNAGDCYFEKDRCDTKDLIDRTNRSGLCGLAHWRLPTLTELESIIFLDAKPGDALIDKDFFPHTHRGNYWTNEKNKTLTGLYRHLKKGAIAVNFGKGQAVTLPYQDASFVRLVATKSEEQN